MKTLSVIKELWFEFLLSLLIIGGLLVSFKAGWLNEGGPLPPFLQLIMLKASLVSLALIHASIARRVILERLDWTEEDRKFKRVLSVILYVAIIYAYAQGA